MISLLRGLMSGEVDTTRPLLSLILLGIVDFCCILIGLEQISIQKIINGIIWISVGVGSGAIGYYWQQIKRKIGRWLVGGGHWLQGKSETGAVTDDKTIPAPPLPKSKLVINWANYRAVEGGGEEFQVGDFLRQIISGDSLIFDIENHSFVIGDKNFVPRDPLFGKQKRLQVNYSYGAEPASTTERREHGRLLLPEDSKIKWLQSEVDRLKAAQPKPVQYPVPELRGKIVSMVSELQGFLGAHGEEPRPPEVHKESGESNEDFLIRYRARNLEPMMKWRAKFLGDYRQELKDKVSRLRDEMLSRAQIDDSLLGIAIDRAENERNDGVAAVQGVIIRLWELALMVNT